METCKICIPCTGCISIGTRSGDAVTIERVIEQVIVSPKRRTFTILVDIFLHNTTSANQHLTVIHLGGLEGRVVTNEYWRDHRNLSANAQSIVSIHDYQDKIVVGQGTLEIAGHKYDLWPDEDRPATTLVGGKLDHDIPFTKWEVGPFLPQHRNVVRLELVMSSASFDKQMGSGKSFFAFGDAILLSLLKENLANYRKTHADAYLFDKSIDAFKAHMLPEIFEWLLVEPEGLGHRWETTALSYQLSRRYLPADFEWRVHWFIADYSLQGLWRVVSRHDNSFAIAVRNQESPLHQQSEGWR